MTIRRHSRRWTSEIYLSGHSQTSPTPKGWVVHLVPRELDGRSVDHVEAAVTFADRWWASQAKYVGISQGFHVWRRPTEGGR